jgi:sulfite exporter TauE/SafE
MVAVVGVFLASLLGSVHCAAMCGPFVLFYSSDLPGPVRPSLRVHGAYNLGRLVSYVALGLAGGAVGAQLDRAGALAGVSRAAAIIAGTLMVAWSGATILALRGVRVGLPGGTPRWHALLARWTGALRQRSAVVRAGAVGLMTALLPCGWLYAFVATAVGTGSPVRGALAMLVFWSGTLPVMISLGLGLQRAAGPLRSRLPAITAAAVMVLGLLSITGRLAPPPAAASPAAHVDHR